MGLRIEDYAMIGDTRTGALVGRNGSIDWWCVPRFDDGACFAALLGDADNGRWVLGPVGEPMCTRRRYRLDTLIMETEWEQRGGTVRVIDYMPVGDDARRIVRIVEGVSGRVDMAMELVIRFDYGNIVPWVRRVDGATLAVAGPDSLCLRTPIEVRGENLRTKAEFPVSAGQRIPFVLTWHPPHEGLAPALDGERALVETEDWWRMWSDGCAPLDGDGRWHDPVRRSLITLKGLTYAPTGGVVAALTTSLPEAIGGVRNWDYRFCWLRDATFSLYALLLSGYESEARAWRDWLLRAVAGRPDQFQILYGPAGERRLTEWEVPWLTGYESSRPVRIGNAAANQFQLDVFGEVMDTLSVARRVGMPESDSAWDLQTALIEELESVWEEPDEGIWEVRGPRRHFVHSKVMAWVAMERAVHAVESGLDGPADRWRRVRDDIHAEVCKLGFNADVGSFTQFYGSKELDASLLMIPQVGFLPIDDPRVQGTIRAVEERLCRNGLVLRYGGGDTPTVDGLPAGEGAFLPCTFWLVDAWAMSGRTKDAIALFDRLVSLSNDVGLLSEEYDIEGERQVGNFPQAFSHLSLINTARNLTQADGRAVAAHRSRTGDCGAEAGQANDGGAPATDRPAG